MVTGVLQAFHPKSSLEAVDEKVSVSRLKLYSGSLTDFHNELSG